VSADDLISAADIAAGKLVFTPGADGNGSSYANFTFQVQDDGGTDNGGVDLDQTSNTITIDVNSVDDAATAKDDAFTTAENAVLAGGSSVFADNGSGDDTDVDSPLEVTAVNGSALSVGSEITLASGAHLTLNADGTFSYDPNHVFDKLPAVGSGAANTSGSDSFTYTLNGGPTATVTVTIAGVDSNDLAMGTAGDDTIATGIGNDTIKGGAGADSMAGGTGNDTYYVDNVADVASENVGEGSRDTVYASANFTLAAGSAIEYLRANAGATGLSLGGNDFANHIFGGRGADTLSGAGGNDSINGGDRADSMSGGIGNDILNGGAGVDSMAGGIGNDTYYVDRAADVASENAGEGGRDTVYASVNFTLAAGSAIEYLRANAGSTGLSLGGNDFANNIFGGTGADSLSGVGGNDIVKGGGGNDVIKGGAGADSLTGGDGNDRFDYTALSQSGITGPTRDKIADFATGDKINVSAIDAIHGGGNNAFVLDNGGAFSAGEIHQTVQGSDLLLQFNTDADSTAEMSILLLNHTALLNADDFIL
jgi:VCBS repeat-containing protein